jgi:hypothetical protein
LKFDLALIVSGMPMLRSIWWLFVIWNSTDFGWVVTGKSSSFWIYSLVFVQRGSYLLRCVVIWPIWGWLGA